MPKRFRAGVIGRTGRGGYGHGLDRVYLGMDEVDIIAVADDDPEGLKEAGRRLGVVNLYSDYREMLAKESFDIVSICPRWLGQHADMVKAAATAGACIFLEKPMARTLDEADAMIAVCEQAGVTMGIAHQGRMMPAAQYARHLLSEGAIGDIVSASLRGKEDRRGGGEDMMVLGTHMFDSLRFLLGRNPAWVMGTVMADDGRLITRNDAVDGPEEIGLIAGDRIHALYGFGNGITATFESRRNQQDPGRFGLQIYGARGIMTVYGNAQQVSIYEAPFWRPDQTALVRDVSREADKTHPPDPNFQNAAMAANAAIVRDVLHAREEKRRPLNSGHDGRWALEMIHGVYASHLYGARVTLPLECRQHPLER